ncbi:MAG: DUF3467 domain-containing protein [Ignavibacteriae bacterium]|nr:DUF3467 domain-containing protein [Ignavibacteriota bacterium]
MEDNVPNIYSNMGQVIHSQKDFAVTFGIVVPPDKLVESKTENVKGEYTVLARVYMSPPQFKALTQVFNLQLKKYEEVFGKIIELSKDLPEGE